MPIDPDRPRWLPEAENRRFDVLSGYGKGFLAALAVDGARRVRRMGAEDTAHRSKKALPGKNFRLCQPMGM